MRFVLFAKLKKKTAPTFPHYAPVSRHKEMRTRLGWTISYKSLTVFCPPEPRVSAFVYWNAGKVYYYGNHAWCFCKTFNHRGSTVWITGYPDTE